MADSTNDDVDLTQEQRRRIDELFARLGELDHHAVLGVDAAADRAAVRRAYFANAAEFHPDRFFRKQLGTYKAKVDAIAKRMAEAYEALRSEAPRSPAQPAPSAAKDPAREKALAALKDQLTARQADARRLVNEAERAASHGDLAGAAVAYRKAAVLVPGNAAIQASAAAATRAAEAGAVDALARQAEFEERFGHWVEAARTWRRILDAKPDDARARERLEVALRKAGSP